ncbi:GNAT family N-acetyltransferase [Tsukamurella sp. 1534]|uniref:GNAT family N-acetyltransferase n=1 Tax=Tsukamurella sp. 1534 TaxID=1151061 RepID=UPI00030CC3C3|nr:GNAT family N-acetyltransferase [Tsukamurella sp. 1534]
MDTPDLAAAWPPFAVELRTPRLTLRVVRDEDLPGLAAAAAAGVHDPGRTPFSVPWTDQSPEALPAAMAQYHWSLRARCRPEDWELAFVVLRDGAPIGAQHLSARDFRVTRTVDSGSWLTRTAQGIGLGKEMRAALLLFAFDRLGAERATSAAMAFNAPSNGVSRALGYRENGRDRVTTRPGVAEELVRLRLDRDEFVRPEWAPAVRGDAPLLRYVGLSDNASRS